MTMQGGCCCGAVRYEISGPTFHRTLCFCPTCRHVAGAPAVAWFSVASRDYRVTRGSPTVFRSSAHVTRSFCGACGTPLTYARDDSTGEIDITTCSLDDPASQPPADLTMTEYRLPWSLHTDALPHRHVRVMD